MDTIPLILSEPVLHTLALGMVKLNSNHAPARVVKLAIDAIPALTAFDQDTDGIGDSAGSDLAYSVSILCRKRKS